MPTIEEIVESYNGGKYAGKVWNLMMCQVWWGRYFGEHEINKAK